MKTFNKERNQIYFNEINEINNSLESNILNETMIKYWDGKTSERIYEILFG